MVTKNKTPAEVEAVTITMSRETAQAVKQACEEYLRFRMGQFEDFTNEVCCWDYVDKMEKRCHTTEERKQFHKDHEADFLKCMRLRNQMRQGMMYGSITQMDYGKTDYTTYAAKRVAKLVVDQDKDTRKLRLGCRPLAAPKTYCPYIYAADVVG